jgi:hypothetical protein
MVFIEIPLDRRQFVAAVRDLPRPWSRDKIYLMFATEQAIYLVNVA